MSTSLYKTRYNAGPVKTSLIHTASTESPTIVQVELAKRWQTLCIVFNPRIHIQLVVMMILVKTMGFVWWTTMILCSTRVNVRKCSVERTAKVGVI